MRSIRVALAQVNPTVGDLSGNAAIIEDAMSRAAGLGADLVLLPELALTGYPPEDLLLRPSFVSANLDRLHDLARASTDVAAIVGFVDRSSDGALHNAAAVLCGGRVRGVYHKVRLPNYGVFDEKRYFEPGDSYPLFEIRGVRVGVVVCEDAWIPDGPVKRLAEAGAEVIAD
ncbi:MAG: nitrilase-related carbon-nitrogen hydrolase, partial [Actinomycetes bacterium]